MGLVPENRVSLNPQELYLKMIGKPLNPLVHHHFPTKMASLHPKLLAKHSVCQLPDHLQTFMNKHQLRIQKAEILHGELGAQFMIEMTLEIVFYVKEQIKRTDRYKYICT